MADKPLAADRYDPLPDLAALLSAAVNMDGIPAACRLAKRLRVTPETSFRVIERRLREALGQETEDAAPTLADRVTTILTDAGHADAQDTFPGGFIATAGTGIVIVTVPWSAAKDGERRRMLARFAEALRDGGLDVAARGRYLQVRDKSGNGGGDA
jgi:hypothetical protein